MGFFSQPAKEPSVKIDEILQASFLSIGLLTLSAVQAKTIS
jgi:hypothetical protein